MISPVMFALAIAQGPSEPMLVSTSWLAGHLTDPHVVLFHIGVRAEYDATHIPGARFLELRDITAPRDTTQPPLELPDPAALDSALEAFGVDDNSRIVVYWGSDWFSPVTRVYLTFYWAGLGARTSVLDGGMPLWRAEGRPVTSDIPAVKQGSLTLHPRADVVVDTAYVARHLRSPDVTIVDARTPSFYAGTDTSYTRPGHIAGARSIPFTTLFAGSKYLPVDSLRAIFRAAVDDDRDTVVTYCHIGQQATAVWFAARLLGYAARVYDGSYRQWDRLPHYPVETSR